jgi:hypothetical protein
VAALAVRKGDERAADFDGGAFLERQVGERLRRLRIIPEAVGTDQELRVRRQRNVEKVGGEDIVVGQSAQRIDDRVGVFVMFGLLRRQRALGDDVIVP